MPKGGKGEAGSQMGAQDLLQLIEKSGKKGFLKMHCCLSRLWKTEKWVQRFIVLHNGSIYVYENAHSKKPLEQFSLLGYEKIQRFNSEKNPWSFSIVPSIGSIGTRSFSCVSDAERKDWMELMKAQMCSANDKDSSEGRYEGRAIARGGAFQSTHQDLFPPFNAQSNQNNSNCSPFERGAEGATSRYENSGYVDDDEVTRRVRIGADLERKGIDTLPGSESYLKAKSIHQGSYLPNIMNSQIDPRQIRRMGNTSKSLKLLRSNDCDDNGAQLRSSSQRHTIHDSPSSNQRPPTMQNPSAAAAAAAAAPLSFPENHQPRGLCEDNESESSTDGSAATFQMEDHSYSPALSLSGHSATRSTSTGSNDPTGSNSSINAATSNVKQETDYLLDSCLVTDPALERNREACQTLLRRTACVGTYLLRKSGASEMLVLAVLTENNQVEEYRLAEKDQTVPVHGSGRIFSIEELLYHFKYNAHIYNLNHFLGDGIFEAEVKQNGYKTIAEKKL